MIYVADGIFVEYAVISVGHPQKADLVKMNGAQLSLFIFLNSILIHNFVISLE